MKKLKEILINYYPVIIYLFLSLFVFGWFKGNDFISGGDFGWPISFERFFDVARNVWDSSVAPGYNASRQVSSVFPYAFYGYIFYKMHLSSAIFERFIFFVSFFFSGFGFYLLALRFVKNKFTAFLSGLAYMLSPYASIIMWSPSYGMVFPFYSYLPLSLSFLIDYYRSEKLLNQKLVIALLVTFLSFIGASFSNPAFFLLYIFIGIVFALSTDKKFLPVLKKIVVYFGLFSLLNAFWIIPFVTSIGDQYKNANNESSGLTSDKGTRLLNSVPLLGAIAESGFWAFTAKEGTDSYYSYSGFFESVVFKLFSYSLVILILVGFIVVDKKHRFLYALYFLGVYLSSGLLFPSLLKLPADIFYNLPLIDRLYRSVFLKTGILITLPFSLLIAIVLDRINLKSDLSRNFFKNSIYSLVIITLIFRSYPFITGDVIKISGKLLPASAFSVPSDYYEIAHYINENIDDSYLLTLPLPKSYNFVYKWKHGGYAGGDFFRTLISKSNYYLNINNPLVEGFANSYDLSLLDRLGVKYILVHKDVPIDFSDRFLTANFYEINALLESNKSLTKIKDTENLALYELQSDKVAPLIYVSDELVSIPTIDSEANVFSKLNFVQTSTESTASVSKQVIIPDVTDNKFRNLEVWHQGWQWPETRVAPNSWKYYLVQIKEWFITLHPKNAKDGIDKYLWLNAKRSAELEKFDVPEKYTSRINLALTSNSQLIEKMLLELKNSDASENKQEYTDTLNKVLRYTQRSLVLIPNNKTESIKILESFYKSLLEESKLSCAQRCVSFKSTFTGVAHIDGIEKLDIYQVNGSDTKKIKKLTPTSFNVTEGTHYLFNQPSRSLPLYDVPAADVNSNIYTTSSINMLEQVQQISNSVGFTIKNPVVLKKEVKNIDPTKKLTLFLEYEETNARISIIVTQRTKELAKDTKALKLGDINSKSLQDASTLMFVKEYININDADTHESSKATYSKDLDISKNATGLEIQVFVYSPLNSTDVSKITALEIIESERSLPLIANYPVVSDKGGTKAVRFDRISSDLYSVFIDNPKGNLIFNTGYDKGWVATTSEGIALTHFMADSYKNAWNLPTSDKPYVVTLRYLPEEYKLYGFYLTTVVFTLLLTSYIATMAIKLIRNYTNK